MRRIRRPGQSHTAPASITVHSMGGLGNQLFIYAAGLAAARASDCELRVDASLHRQDPARPFELESIGLPASYADLELRREPPEGCDFREQGFTYSDAALAVGAGTCMFGYFQSWRYLEPVADELRTRLRDLRVESARKPSYVRARESIGSPGAIVLHVRRGDYLHSHARNWHGLSGLPYYEEAVGVLRHMGFDGPLVLFSDDPAGSLTELAPIGDVEPAIVPGRTDLTSLDEMLLMSEASAIVTANSSFSWWAGWLEDRPDRPVICPRPWFDTRDLDTRDLLPRTWITLGR